MERLRRLVRQLQRIMREKAARRTFLEGLSFGLVLVSIGMALLLVSRETAIDDWKKLSRTFALTVAQSVNQSLVSSDLILKSIGDSVRESRLTTPDELRQALATPETFAMLQARMAITPGISRRAASAVAK